MQISVTTPTDMNYVLWDLQPAVTLVLITHTSSVVHHFGPDRPRQRTATMIYDQMPEYMITFPSAPAVPCVFSYNEQVLAC